MDLVFHKEQIILLLTISTNVSHHNIPKDTEP